MRPTGQLTLQDRLDPIFALLQKQQIVESLAHRQTGSSTPLVEQLVHRQHEEELKRKLRTLKAADTAHLLEMLPPERRLFVWDLMADQQAADTLLELNEGVLHSVLSHTSRERLQTILGCLDADDLADIADFIEPDILAAVKAGLEDHARHWLENTLTYPDDSVGSLMSRDSLLLSSSLKVDEAIATIRGLPHLPEQTDKLFIVNGHRVLVGVVPFTALLRHEGDVLLENIMELNVVKFRPQDKAEDAAYAFERYDLICAPVVDERNRVIGRLTVETMMDYLREHNEALELAKQGLSARADLFGPVWSGAKTRWLWLSINLVTAFCATRFIAMFAESIETLVALAALMPIVASMGGNTGQQTAALMIRSLTLDQINRNNLVIALRKEMAVSLINGGIWGLVLGVLAAALYNNVGLGFVMMVAILLNLFIAALAGILTPLLIDRLGKDPAMGSSVILTFITDSMGFFMFLGLATAWLM
jgi:magnesium transporter